MEPSELFALVEEVDLIYSADKKGRGLVGVYDWIKGEDPQGYRKEIYRLLCEMNSRPSTSRFSLDAEIKKKIVDELSHYL